MTESERGRLGLEALFLAAQKIAPFRGSFVETPFRTLGEFLTHLARVNPGFQSALGMTLLEAAKDVSLTDDEAEEALVDAAERIAGVWNSKTSPQIVFSEIQKKMSEFKWRHVWGGSREAAKSLATEIPQTLVDVGQTVKKVGVGIGVMAPFLPWIALVGGGYILVKNKEVISNLIGTLLKRGASK